MIIPPVARAEFPPIFDRIEDYPRQMIKISSTFYTEIAQISEDQSNSSIPLEIDPSIDHNLSEARLDSSCENLKFCSICCTNIPDAIIMKCGHAGLCFECACEL